MPLFYIPEARGKEECFMNTDESFHCIKVMRKQAGERIYLTDGKGGYYTADIIDPTPDKVKLKIVDYTEKEDEREYYLHVVIAPTKNADRMEWFVEKATEIGIDEITLINCARSERKVMRSNRLIKKMISAMKQSGRTRLPVLNEMVAIDKFLEQCDTNADRFIAYCNEDRTPHLIHVPSFSDYLILLIGPEGDFSEQELALSERNNFKQVRLGDSVLRTETAGIAACQIIADKYQAKK